MYFNEDDSIRKKIQGVFMGKVDCIVEMHKEEFDNGFDKAMFKMAKKLLLENFPVETVSRITN